MWPEQAEGTSAPGVPQDDTPETGSPVDLDTPLPDPMPVVAPVTTPVKKAPPRRPPVWQRAVLGFPVWILFAFVALVLVVFLVIVRSGDPGTNSADRIKTTEVPTTLPSQVLPAATVAAPTTSAAATAPAPTAAPPVFTLPESPVAAPPTAPATVPTTSAATEGPAPQAPATVPPTAPPVTAPPVTALPAATLPTDGPVVTIIGRVGPCDYGAQCLLAGFALHNFDAQPSEFVCEFADGSRYTFHFTRQQVERACATGNVNGSITIEVDGVRSATFTRP
jgi:hypothetical protein